MAIKLDYYDKKILFELDKNARVTTSSLAKKIRKSKQFVDYRIKKLEQGKIILGYTSVIDYSKIMLNRSIDSRYVGRTEWTDPLILSGFLFIVSLFLSLLGGLINVLIPEILQYDFLSNM